jgi:pyrroline-5-carboxylate reductase
MNIGFIGFGKMGEAIAQALLAAGKAGAKQMYAGDADSVRLKRAGELGLNALRDNKAVVESSETVFLCVKPQDAEAVLGEISVLSGERTFISIAAGIRLSVLEKRLKGKIVRAMPNAPLVVREGISAVAFGKGFSEAEKEEVKGLLSCCGKVLELQEQKFDAVTALSGSGPAFYALVVDALAAAAVGNGLDREEALLLAEQTALGTAKLLMLKGMNPDKLIGMVSSEGGTTEQGMEVLRSSSLRDILRDAVDAAVRRSREMGESK